MREGPEKIGIKLWQGDATLAHSDRVAASCLLVDMQPESPTFEAEASSAPTTDSRRLGFKARTWDSLPTQGLPGSNSEAGSGYMFCLRIALAASLMSEGFTVFLPACAASSTACFEI